jgi:hypothetical protein
MAMAIPPSPPIYPFTGSLPCVVCNQNASHGYITNGAFELYQELNQIRDPHPICPKCFLRTKKLLNCLNKTNSKKLPLYISHPNKFVRIRASRLLGIS